MPLEILDRSTLEVWATCPRQASLVASGSADCVGLEAISGCESHDAISYAVTSYVDSQGAMSVSELSELIMDGAIKSRPDVQPDVIKALRPFAWEFSKFLNSLHHQDVMAWDGGEGKRSSQLAYDFPHFGCRVTSELDFVYSTPSPEKIRILDYKTGHARWNEEAIRESFQFGKHAWLAMENWPSVECVEVSIWNTRINQRTYAVPFLRKNIEAYKQRVHKSAEYWNRYRNQKPESVPAWPSPDKCEQCPCVLKCASASKEVFAIQSDPAVMVTWATLGLQAIDKIKKTLAPMLAAGDIKTPEGFAFGYGKKKADRKPTAVFYKEKTNGDGDDEAGTEG